LKNSLRVTALELSPAGVDINISNLVGRNPWESPKLLPQCCQGKTRWQDWLQVWYDI